MPGQRGRAANETKAVHSIQTDKALTYEIGSTALGRSEAYPALSFLAKTYLSSPGPKQAGTGRALLGFEARDHRKAQIASERRTKHGTLERR